MSDSVAGMKRFARKSVTENLGLKLVALVIALALVIGVRFQEKSEGWVDVEVAVRRPASSSGVVLTSQPPDTVRVFLRARESVLAQVKRGAVPQVEMDVSDRDKPGSFTYYFDPESFGFGPGVEVIRVSPESVIARLEKLVTRRLQVRAETFGRLESGAELDGDPRVEPQDVTIAGAASLVRPLVELETESVDLEGLGVGEHRIELPLRRIDGVEVRHDGDVTVVLRVRWIPGQRTVPGLLVRVAGADLPAEVHPRAVEVSLVGPRVALDRLDPADVIPEVAVDEERSGRPGVFEASVSVKGLPPDVKVESVTPGSVEVKISPAPKGARGGAAG